VVFEGGKAGNDFPIDAEGRERERRSLALAPERGSSRESASKVLRFGSSNLRRYTSTSGEDIVASLGRRVRRTVRLTAASVCCPSAAWEPSIA